ncbi:MAG TPA: sugar ABC transporter substrate-binding protein, partial [Noviherbaspirillum sp.]|nr:sugar ABC transporter substrate-binding protein [Noviherbaspirillum sp.]
MRAIDFFSRFMLVATVSVLASGTPAQAENTITLAAGERAPYIGKTLPGNGYVAELAIEAFRRQGYRVKIEFYPWARARMLADIGEVNGLLPVFREEDRSSQAGFVYSNPFPGDTIGFLKKKTLRFSYSKQDLEKEDAFLRSLQNYRLGTVRGGIDLPLFNRAEFPVKEMASEDIHNLDKLALDRIQLALIDKYTAADLMAEKRPQFIGQFDFMTPPLAQRDFYISFPTKAKNHRQLAAAFNKG